MFSRRGFVASSTSAFLAGCASTNSPLLSAPLQPRGAPIVLAPADISADRVIRRMVGLRPFRPGGFVPRRSGPSAWCTTTATAGVV